MRRLTHLIISTILGIYFFIIPAFCQEIIIEGQAKAVDGDTLVLNNLYIRLNGIAAPELDEKGGTAAKSAMSQLLFDKNIRCSLSGQKSYQRHIGTCWIGKLDIAASIIADGKARDCPRYSLNRYRALETNNSKLLVLHSYCIRK